MENKNRSGIFLGVIGVATLIVAIILTSTIVYELIGPVITKISLLKAGEITEEQI